MQNFRELVVWQKSHQLVLDVYRLSRGFPDDERYGVTSQLRRAGASIPTNIAEGCKRRSARDYARFLNISEGSLSETAYLLILCKDLGYLPSNDADRLLLLTEELSKMLHSLRTKVEQSAP